MVGSSILPVTFHKNKLYFLFGKESPSETSAPGWSDFGGGMDPGENAFDTALREGGEELTGFLGDSTTLKQHIKTHGGTYNINYDDKYHIHVMFIPYDENLPKYYNQNHKFLWDRMDQTLLKKTKLFEKIEIGWFSVQQTQKMRNKFRFFYREILDRIMKDIPNIQNYFKGENAAKRSFRPTLCNEVEESNGNRRFSRVKTQKGKRRTIKYTNN